MTKSNSINSLVSVIVPTYNSSATLGACLESIRNQTHKNIEIIVVDNGSKDDTKNIAMKYTNMVFNKGPERSTQRNYGVSMANGLYVLIIDSDMILQDLVINECIQAICDDEKVSGVIIPEESFGVGFWAHAKKLERSYYIGVDWIEAARFFPIRLYRDVGGYDESMVSGEDWDLSQRIAAYGKTGRSTALILHNEGRLQLRRTLQKKFYYSKSIARYAKKTRSSNPALLKKQISPLSRYGLFFSNPSKLFNNPIVGIGMLFMKTAEFAFGGIGLVAGNAVKEKDK